MQDFFYFQTGKLVLPDAFRISIFTTEFLSMTIQFNYDKGQVLQALRYHFLSKKEIRIMIILVNVFALASAALFYFKKILPLAFVVGSVLWFALMLSFWFILPGMVYRRAATFRDHFIMHFDESSFSVGNERGSRSWPWTALTEFLETPYFFHLYFDSRSFFLVPKNAFANSDEIYQLRHLMQEKIPSKKK